MKTKTIEFDAFMDGTWREQERRKIKTAATTSIFLFSITAPTIAKAQAENDAFESVYVEVLKIVDWGAVLVFTFSGVNFMLGNRTRAMELLIGASVGYILTRHAIDIRDFLKAI